MSRCYFVLKIVAVAARSLEAAETFAARHGIQKAYGSYEKIASDPDIGTSMQHFMMCTWLLVLKPVAWVILFLFYQQVTTYYSDGLRVSSQCIYS